MINRQLQKVFDFLHVSSTGLFITYCLIQWLFNFASSTIVPTDDLFDRYVDERQKEKYGSDYDELADEFEDDIDEYEEENDESYWRSELFNFGFSSLFKLLQFIGVSTFLFVALLLSSDTSHISFGLIFKVVIISSFIFFLATIIEIIWFGVFKKNYDYWDINNFYPLSLLTLFSIESINDCWYYPLKTINLFEVTFVYLLLVGIGNYSGLRITKIAKPIILSYSLMLFAWISFRIYLATLF